MNKQRLKQKETPLGGEVSVYDYQSMGEEIANSITHGIGILFGIFITAVDHMQK